MTGLKALSLHPKTYQQLELLSASRPHAILLGGSAGVGLGTIAKALAVSMVTNPHTIRMVVPDEKGTIAIEAIRSLYISTRSKHHETTAIVVDDADRMSLPAQNAFLKLLEEPTPHTTFILTSHQPLSLLPTIRSRVQTLDVLPVSQEMSSHILGRHGVGDHTLMRQLLFLAAGRPALLIRLATDPALQKKFLTYAAAAKTLVGGPVYARVCVAASLGSDRQGALIVTEVALRMIEAQLKSSATDELVDRAEVFLRTFERLSANGNVRAQLLSLSL